MCKVVPVCLPSPTVAVVVPDDGGEVLVFVDPRVPFGDGHAVINRVNKALRKMGDRRLNISRALDTCPYAVG